MLSTLFDEQAQREQYDIAVKEESKAEGIDLGMAKMVRKLYDLGKNIMQIANTFEMPETEVERLLAIDVSI